MELIPENADSVKVWDVAAIIAADADAAVPRDLTEGILEFFLSGSHSIEDVNSFATGGGVSVMDGDFDFNSIRSPGGPY